MKYGWKKFAYTATTLPHYISDTSGKELSVPVRSKKVERWSAWQITRHAGHHRWCAYCTKSSRNTSAGSVYSALWWKQWWKHTAPVMCSNMPWELRLLFLQLQGFHCILALCSRKDDAKRLQWERGTTNCVSHLRRYVPRYTPKWTVHEISADSVIYIEGCACGMGNFVCQ